ncbi:aspartate ammonia-lyase [Parvibium lacunae]|uniref:Aspartate ammonia-lyase n=1 Tax=Parvibium lacunae TaxID=1888893 RepID=A0A368L4E6_9BURK|nr:aspartate ammonia-lyase [Parvibium lacunae]RCS58030.1 aspartate ammonia-lyase [Parvibium lacunae]
MSAQTIRIESDLLGDREIPAAAYWGVHTLRAVENFPISGIQIGSIKELVVALCQVKKAAARANQTLGLLQTEKAAVILKACDDIIAGKLHEQFVVDVIQGGAGTSTNMNANEVIANRALEILGFGKGQYEHLHPNDDVNQSQSTNDVYPTAIRLGLVYLIDQLLVAMAQLRQAYDAKAKEFADVLKMGRTQLQDAVPMTLGQEFSTYAVMLAEDEQRVREAQALMREINLGATAIGTGINTDPEYAGLATQYLSEITGLHMIKADNMIEATQDTGAYVQLSGVLKRVAVKLSKVCNDLRLLSSGPQAGLGEINLPAKQAGSSIMPGKVNPVIPEVVNQIAFEVVGNDIAVTMAAEGGQLQLNAFEPIIFWSLVKSIRHLTNGCHTLRQQCVQGITANRELLLQRVQQSAGLATALNPYIGYKNATKVARTAVETGRSVGDLVLELGLLTQAQLDEILQPAVLTQPVKLKK